MQVAPVCLSTSSPFSDNKGRLFLCDEVDPELVQRSSLLRSLLVAGNNSRLHDGITLEAFNEWRRTCCKDELSMRFVSHRSLCNILRVADALDDSHTDEWISHAVAKMMSSHQQVCESAELVTSLPLPLQSRLFRQALTSHATEPECLLAAFPAKAHNTIISSMISADRALHATLGTHPDAFLEALAALTNRPSFTALYLHNTGSPNISQPTTNLIARILTNDSEISAFHLSGCVLGDSNFAILAPAIACCPTLNRVALTSPTNRGCLLYSALPLLASTLACLPALSSLSICLHHPISFPPPNPFSLNTLLATCTALTALTLRYNASADTAPLTIQPHLVLPRLQHLHLSTSGHSTPPLLQCLYSQPTRLHFTVHHVCTVDDLSPDCSHSTQPFLSLPAFTALRDVSITVHHTSLRPGWRAFLLDRLPTTLAQLTTLRAFEAKGLCSDTVLRCAYGAIAGSPALTQLQVRVPSAAPDAPPVLASVWDKFLCSLQRLHDLRALRLELAGTIGDADASRMAEVLFCVTRLSVLHLTTTAQRLWPPAALAALSRLTCLQCLELMHQQLGPPGDPAPADAFVSALRTLRLLTVLDLQHCGLDERFTDAGLARAVSGLSRLQRVTLAGNQLRAAAPLVAAAVLELPDIQEVDVSDNGCPLPLEPEGSWADSEGPAEGDIVGSCGEMQALSAVARSRGVRFKEGDGMLRAVSCASLHVSHRNGSVMRCSVQHRACREGEGAPRTAVRAHGC
eukprot:jgi/Ulvmu1/10157/UM006_0111.1